MTSSNSNNNACTSSACSSGNGGGVGGESSSIRSGINGRKSVFHRYPSSQKKLGPAPFASFEASFDDESGSSAAAAAAAAALTDAEPPKRLPEILEHDPHNKQSRSSSKSGLQTPSTPRIDISSASTPSNDESNNSDEKELFQGGLGLAFQEDDQDLRSSTEELDFEVFEFTEKKIDFERRASQPPPIVERRSSLTPELFDRKLSLSLRHGSFGAAGNIERPKSSLSVRSTVSGRRSCSPHKMLLETSFCGNKPIPTQSIDLESPPRTNQIIIPSPLLRTAEVTVHSSTSAAAAVSTSSETCNQSSNSPKSSHHWRPISPAQKLEFGQLPLYNHQQQEYYHHEEPTEVSLQDVPFCSSSSKVSSHHELQFTPRESPIELPPPESFATFGSGRFDDGNNSKFHACEATVATTGIIESPMTPPLPPDEFRTPEPKQSIISSSSSSESLPYVPTTLPMEKSRISITPIAQRSNSPLLPLERPRCSQQLSPASLNDYIVHSSNNIEVDKMKISLPKGDVDYGSCSSSGGGVGGGSSSVGGSGGSYVGGDGSRSSSSSGTTVKKIGASTNWVDFAEMGLRSPRRRRTSRGGTIDCD